MDSAIRFLWKKSISYYMSFDQWNNIENFLYCCCRDLKKRIKKKEMSANEPSATGQVTETSSTTTTASAPLQASTTGTEKTVKETTTTFGSREQPPMGGGNCPMPDKSCCPPMAVHCRRWGVIALAIALLVLFAIFGIWAGFVND